ncbi:MAG: ribonuclease P protein component [Bacteroidales bacterium]|nr:ribonuclease P protein component [Bacteroidales bacterium]
MTFSLPKVEIINLKKDIDNLLESGEVIFRYPLKVYLKRGNGEALNRVMFSVSKRNFKRAVKRNLLKRRLREAYRLNKAILTSDTVKTDILFIYIGKEVHEYSLISKAMCGVLEAINKGNQKNSNSTDSAVD